MSIPVIGDPAVDVAIISEMKNAVAVVNNLVGTLLDIKNLNESSTRGARRLSRDLRLAADAVEFQVNEHSRTLLRQAIGGK